MDQNLPFSCSDIIRGRYEHWIYRDILAYHRLASGAGTQRDLVQILNHPNRYLSRDVASCGLDQRAMDKAVYSEDKPYWQVANARKTIASFYDLLRLLKGSGPKRTMEALEYAGDYLQYLSQYAEYRNEDEEELTAIWNQLREDAAGMADFDAWKQFGEEYMARLRESTRERTGITLSTMHRAKGLEWESVYIIDADEGIHPYKEAESDVELEEERRLFYVAMTRAKDNLTIQYYKTAGGKAFDPSPYLQEIRKNLADAERRRRETAARSLIRKIQDASLAASRAALETAPAAQQKSPAGGQEELVEQPTADGQQRAEQPAKQADALTQHISIPGALTKEEQEILETALNNYLRMQVPGWRDSDLTGVAARGADRAAAYVRRPAGKKKKGGK